MGILIASYLDRVCSIWPEGMTFTPRVRAASRRIVNIERQYFGDMCSVEIFTAGLAEWERIVINEVKGYKEGKATP